MITDHCYFFDTFFKLYVRALSILYKCYSVNACPDRENGNNGRTL